MTEIHCDTHGTQNVAHVCQHLVQSMYDDVPRGLWTAIDEDGDINAYCDACEARRAASGDGWPDDAAEFLGLKLLCRECFEKLRSLNDDGVN